MQEAWNGIGQAYLENYIYAYPVIETLKCVHVFVWQKGHITLTEKTFIRFCCLCPTGHTRGVQPPLSPGVHPGVPGHDTSEGQGRHVDLLPEGTTWTERHWTYHTVTHTLTPALSPLSDLICINTVSIKAWAFVCRLVPILIVISSVYIFMWVYV